jgi:hypothetical protein
MRDEDRMREVYYDQTKIRRVLRIGDLVSYFLSTLAARLVLPSGTPFSILSVVEEYLLFALIWMVIAPFGGLFRAGIALDRGQLWLVAVLTLIATPLGAWFGELWIGKELELEFVLLVTVIATIILTGWRYAFIRIGVPNLK